MANQATTCETCRYGMAPFNLEPCRTCLQGFEDNYEPREDCLGYRFMAAVITAAMILGAVALWGMYL